MTVKEIFETMDYGPAPESATEALAWIKGHGGRFGQFIAGRFTGRAPPSPPPTPPTGRRWPK